VSDGITHGIGGSGWTNIASIADFMPGQYGKLSVWRKWNAASEEGTVTFTSSKVGYHTSGLVEISGISDDPFDGFGSDVVITNLFDNITVPAPDFTSTQDRGIWLLFIGTLGAGTGDLANIEPGNSHPTDFVHQSDPAVIYATGSGVKRAGLGFYTQQRTVAGSPAGTWQAHIPSGGRMAMTFGLALKAKAATADVITPEAGRARLYSKPLAGAAALTQKDDLAGDFPLPKIRSVTNFVQATEGRNNVAYAGLTTIDQAVVTIGPTGMVVLNWDIQASAGAGGEVALCAVEVVVDDDPAFGSPTFLSGFDPVNATAAADDRGGAAEGTNWQTVGRHSFHTGLVPGEHLRARLKYRRTGSASASFRRRRVSLLAL
jgi:hypothetical protein